MRDIGVNGLTLVAQFSKQTTQTEAAKKARYVFASP